MKPHSRINPTGFVLAALAIVMAGCASIASLSLCGQIENSRYVAPESLFSCPVPDLGVEVHTSDSIDRKSDSEIAGTVGFVGLKSVYRIDYLKEATHAASPQEELEQMLNIQLDLYRRIPSRPYVLLQESTEGRLFAVLVAPEGNRNVVDGFGKYRDLSRAMLIFKRGDYVYAVSTDDEDTFAVAADKSPERLNRLRKQVAEFAATIQFRQ